MRIFFAISEGSVAGITKKSVGDLFISPYPTAFDFDTNVNKLYNLIIKDIHACTVFMQRSLCKGLI